MRLSARLRVNVRHRVWMFLADRPIAAALLPRISRGNVRPVTSGTDLVVEGYPRSGNTFLYSLLRQAATRPHDIAHHTHGIASLRMARDRQVPSAIVIRDPDGAVSSLCLRYPGLSPRIAWERYIRYHTWLLANTNTFLYVDFNHLTRSPFLVADQVLAAADDKVRTDISHESILDRTNHAIRSMHAADRGLTQDRESGLAVPSTIDPPGTHPQPLRPVAEKGDERCARIHDKRRTARDLYRRLVERIAPG